MQYTIVALTRACAVLVNQQLLQAFMARKNNWVRQQTLDLKHKQEQQKQKLLRMQKPTALAIKEQVTAEVDEIMRRANEESTSRSISNNKSKSSKRSPDLAQLISKFTRDAKRHTTEEKTSFPEEEEEGEESGVTTRNYSTKNIFLLAPNVYAYS